MRGVKPIPRDTRVPIRFTEDGSIHPEHHSIFDTWTASMQGDNGWMGEPLLRVEVKRGMWGTPHWQASFYDGGTWGQPAILQGSKAREIPRFTMRLPGTLTEEEAQRVALTYMDVLEIRRVK